MGAAHSKQPVPEVILLLKLKQNRPVGDLLKEVNVFREDGAIFLCQGANSRPGELPAAEGNQT